MKKITFVRHGESQANADGLLAGARTDSDLTPYGEQQAHDIVKNIGQHTVEIIVSSPLSRALQTAKIIAADIQYVGPIEMSELLVERDFGSATNMPKSEAFAALDNGTATDAETIEDFARRAERTIAWLHDLSAEHILLVSHAGFGQMLGTILEGGRPEDFLAYTHLGNAGTFTFELK